MPKSHMMTGTPLYKVWCGMKQRCKGTTTDEDRKHYRDRGIKVCNKWRGPHSFLRFYKWAMKRGYKPGKILDRKDNDKGYSPKNCRWVSDVVSSRHRRKRAHHKGRKTTSRYKGVSLQRKVGTWRVEIGIAPGLKMTVGTFKREVEAAKAYDRAAFFYHGEDAILNFPEDYK